MATRNARKRTKKSRQAVTSEAKSVQSSTPAVEETMAEVQATPQSADQAEPRPPGRPPGSPNTTATSRVVREGCPKCGCNGERDREPYSAKTVLETGGPDADGLRSFRVWRTTRCRNCGQSYRDIFDIRSKHKP